MAGVLMGARLLSRQEAAAALAVSVSTIDRLVRSGQLPVVRPTPGGRAVRFTDTAINAFALRQTTVTPPPALERPVRRQVRQSVRPVYPPARFGTSTRA
jgi:excisionase family DNA binding protein